MDYGYTCGRQVYLSDTSLTRATPERLRDEPNSVYKALYKCPVYLLNYAGSQTPVDRQWTVSGKANPKAALTCEIKLK